MISASVRGGPELRYVAAKLRKAAARDLTRELRRGQRQAFRPMGREIKAEAAATLPKRGGYAAVMARSVKVSIVANIGRAILRARIYARGKVDLRDVRAINAGTLRHPVFGNRRAWKITHVRPGFVDRPVDRLMDRVLDDSAEAAEKVLQQIART